jgi:hypothetical protein
MPWDESEDYIRSGHRDPDEFDKDSFRTIDIDKEKGIKAVVGCPKGQYEGGKCKVGMEVQSFLFDKSKGWTMDKAKDWFEKHKESETKPSEHIEKIRIQEKLVPFKFTALAAKPGKSLNGRIYSEEVLRKAAPLYKGKPFIMDHDYQNADKVIGVITDSYYEDGIKVEGLGLMHEDLFAKVAGTDKVPPLIKGVSIGGQGEGEFTSLGVDIRSFTPEELSLTAFPGIPEAQLLQIEAIRESYKKMEVEKTVEKPKVEEKKAEGETVIDIPVEEAQKIAEKEPRLAPQMAEADIPSSPDSKRFTPPQVTPGAPVMGGHQTGGIAAVPEPPKVPETPPQAPERVKASEEPKVVTTRSVAVLPGQLAAFEPPKGTVDIIKRAEEILKEMNGDAKKAYYKMAKEILEQYGYT